MPLYDAFISYSHAKDKPIAAALQLASLSFVLGAALEQPFGLIQTVDSGAVAVLLFLLIRKAWKRDA